MIFKRKYRKGVFIVTYAIEKGKPIYLIQKRKLHWKGYEFPKGGVNFLETRKHAVKREIKEETGLQIIKIKKHNESGKFKYVESLNDRKNIIGQTYKLYSAEVKKVKIVLDKREHSSASWMSYEEASKKLTYSNQKKCLKIVHKFLTN